MTSPQQKYSPSMSMERDQNNRYSFDPADIGLVLHCTPVYGGPNRKVRITKVGTKYVYAKVITTSEGKLANDYQGFDVRFDRSGMYRPYYGVPCYRVKSSATVSSGTTFNISLDIDESVSWRSLDQAAEKLLEAIYRYGPSHLARWHAAGITANDIDVMTRLLNQGK